MDSLRLIRLAIRYHWDAHRSNPVNLMAAIVGMVLNNAIVLWGLWAMLFDGKENSQTMTVYFLTLNGMIVVAWGTVCVFLGGLHQLGTYIEEGSLEPMLATPRSPLLMVGISSSIAPALGDLLQGCINVIALFFISTPAQALRCALFISVSSVAVFGLFVLTGSLAFFVKRGSSLSLLVREMCLSLSFYPTGKVFVSTGRWLLFLTPAAVTAILPMDAIDSGSWSAAAIAIVATVVFVRLAVAVFYSGLKRYQAANYIAARG